MADLIIIAVVAVIIGLTVGYIYKAKKHGTKCIGCPSDGCASCPSKGCCGGSDSTKSNGSGCH